ncbi:MAG: 3-keto-5-aminohexanoate cleavage protein [Leptospiraceae bacterium]|nr:3-keto-5-aminohexanoate cleavage protein [Leptospiraceae bacterium]
MEGITLSLDDMSLHPFDLERQPESILSEKVVITAALTGVAANRKQCPAIPYTPAEIGEEARRAAEAGASVVHIHAREDDGSPSHRVEVYAAIAEEVRKRSDVIINFSTGAVGVEKEDRVRHITEVRPEIAALNMGTMNYAKYSGSRKSFVFNFVFENSMDTIQFFLDAMNKAGVRPELECFDTGHVATIAPFVDLGLLTPPLQFSFILGVLGGAPATARQLARMVEMTPAGSHWEVIGISHVQWTLIAAALSMGGNIRVGLEDNFYVSPGEMATSNGDLVDKAARMARDCGREVASIEESRKILGLSAARVS